jgi:hypothetical protein
MMRLLRYRDTNQHIIISFTVPRELACVEAENPILDWLVLLKICFAQCPISSGTLKYNYFAVFRCPTKSWYSHIPYHTPLEISRSNRTVKYLTLLRPFLLQ